MYCQGTNDNKCFGDLGGYYILSLGVPSVTQNSVSISNRNLKKYKHGMICLFASYEWIINKEYSVIFILNE